VDDEDRELGRWTVGAWAADVLVVVPSGHGVILRQFLVSSRSEICYYHSTKMGLVVIVVAPVLASKAASKARAGLLLAALRT
jgi:hypothetical protein